MRRIIIPLSVWILLSTSVSNAFQILSPASDGCHERMMLDALDGSPTLVLKFATRAKKIGVPEDDATLGMIRSLADDHRFDTSDPARAWVLASFLAGVREPDSHGFSIADLNEVRGVHLRSEEQSAHFLRAHEDDGPLADRRAVERAKTRIMEKSALALSSWEDARELVRPETYNLPFYGDVTVRVFAPAFDLGLASHVVQDSYSHTVRDEQLRILAVANFVDVILHEYDERTDGPGHSDRMDRCKFEEDEFDSLRGELSRRDTIDLLADFEMEVETGLPNPSALRDRLDRIFVVRDGCNIDDLYCGSAWYTEFAKGSTKPWKVSCTGISGPDFFASHANPLERGSALGGLLAVLFFWWRLRCSVAR